MISLANFGSAADEGRARRPQREAVDIREPKPKDKSLDKLIGVRNHRLAIFEREKSEARSHWRAERVRITELKEEWRAAVEQTNHLWSNARAEFFAMKATSGEFRKAKAIYERMKKEAAELHLEAKKAVEPARAAGAEFFVAKQRLADAHKQCEKLAILRDEIHLMNREPED